MIGQKNPNLSGCKFVHIVLAMTRTLVGEIEGAEAGLLMKVWAHHCENGGWYLDGP